ncbi:MAG: AAA family ATPase [Deltaproteobacteria bacterium]|jgi:hypothetical protein|nr:AAA family ATPase [Deltaproteobacteria bacterium]
MANKPEPKLLLETSQSFQDYIEQNALYIDKTGMIRDIMRVKDGPYLLVRPRRFGKTLLLDTIQHVAEGHKDLFTGLEIYNSDYDWKPYGVIRLNMNGINYNPEFFESSLLSHLHNVAALHEVSVSNIDPISAINDLIIQTSIKYHKLFRKSETEKISSHPQNVALLIDEYDFPFMSNVTLPNNIEKISRVLHNFYSVIKSCFSFLRIVFITGVAKLPEFSLSSAFNTMIDITIDSNYSTICGFTMEEIKSYFELHIPSTINELIKNNQLESKSTSKALYQKLEHWYDGYTWDGETHVLNPYSVIHFFLNCSYRDYWYKSGAPISLRKLGFGLKKYFSVFNDNISFSSDYPAVDPENINDYALLLHNGYLTIDKIEKSDIADTYNLKIPNNEIRNAIMTEFLVESIVPKNSVDPIKFVNSKRFDFYKSFCMLDESTSEMLLTSILASISYHLQDSQEKTFHLILYFLLGVGYDTPLNELDTDVGRSDLVFQTPQGDCMIVEIKHEKAHDSKINICDTKISQSPALSDIIHLDNPPSIRHSIGKNNNNSKPDTISPAKKIFSGQISEVASRSLQTCIELAFEQIVTKHYALPHIGNQNKVIACAVAIYGTSDVRIRFAEVIFSNNVKQFVHITRSIN